MSSPLLVDDLIQVTYVGRLLAQQIITVLHMRVVTAPSGPSTAEGQLQLLLDGKLAVRADNPFLDHYIDAAANNYTMDYVRAQRIRPTRSVYAQAAISLPGEWPAAATTANLAASIEKQSLHAGRKGVGRVQFGPIAADVIINGIVDSDYRAVQLQDLADDLYGSITPPSPLGGEFRYCLPAGGTDHSYDIYNAFPMDTVRTMHRRTLRLGV